MTGRPWVFPLAVGLALVMVAGAVPPALTMFFVFASGLAFVFAGFVALRNRADPYDLARLRDLHEREVVRDIEIVEPEEFDSIQCVRCGAVYSNKLPVCPQCKSSP
jgi:hypothetical protein